MGTKRIEIIKQAIEAAYTCGWQDARQELLLALRDSELRVAVLEALARKVYEEKNDE